MVNILDFVCYQSVCSSAKRVVSYCFMIVKKKLRFFAKTRWSRNFFTEMHTCQLCWSFRFTVQFI